MRFFFSSPVADSFQPQRHGDAEKTKRWGETRRQRAVPFHTRDSRAEGAEETCR